LFSNSISIGFNIQPTAANQINIGNVYKGDITTGNAEVKSITISGRQITFDDNYMYVTTSTGVVKKVALQEVAAAKTTTQEQTYMLYELNGQSTGRYLIAKPVNKN
jgi:hypothetical protein